MDFYNIYTYVYGPFYNFFLAFNLEIPMLKYVYNICSKPRKPEIPDRNAGNF